MSNKTYLFLLVLAFSISLNAKNKMSSYTQLMLNVAQRAEIQKTHGLSLCGVKGGNKSAKAVIELQNGAEIPEDELIALGVKVNCVVGNYVTANIPVDKFDEVAEIEEVKLVSMARPVSLSNNYARSKSNVDAVQKGIGLPKAFNGEGVLLGIVDSGIDFNHINFKNDDGSTRIKIAGVYDPSQDAYNIHYDEERIATLTTDNEEASHGTHVAGIAAGGYKGNEYYGMAPRADLGFFGLENNLYDADIINGIFWIFYQADSSNQPSVVNVSIGSTVGPHDGTSYFNQMVDQMCGPGKVVVVAAGNNGDERVYLNKRFLPASKEVATIVECGGTNYASMVNVWSDSDKTIGTQFFIYNRSDGSEVCASEIFQPDGSEYTEYIWNSVDTGVSEYFNGTIGFASMIDDYNGKYTVDALILGDLTNNNYRIGIRFFGNSGSEMHCWAYPTPTEFVSSGNNKYTEGTTDNSINDMACGKSVISVGSYNSNLSFTGIGSDGVAGPVGTKFSYDGTEGDVSFFSSYGRDFTGRVHPDIVAPGASLVSSVNAYDSYTVDRNYSVLIDEVEVKNSTRKYHWGDMMGTSMASPLVTGVVALMLQVNPQLDTQQVRDILQSSAVIDSYVTSSSSSYKWGASGKLDAKTAVMMALNTTSIKDISIPNDVLMLYPNPTEGRFTIYVGNEDKELSLSIYNLNGSLVYKEGIMPCGGIVDVDVTSDVAKGVYVVKIENDNINYSSRLIIK